MRKIVMMRKMRGDGNLNNESMKREWQSMVLEMKVEESVCSKREIPAMSKRRDILRRRGRIGMRGQSSASKIDQLYEISYVPDDSRIPANTISPAEATLNWQSENAVAQNKVLVKILSQQGMITNSQEYLSSRVRSLESINNELRFKIQELHREIIQIIQTSPTNQPSSSISQKEAEMKNLKNQLQDLERQHKQKRITSLIDDPWRLPSTPFVGVSFDPQPLPRSYTHTTSPSLNNNGASEQKKC
ncbi:hypothetical protein Tco_1316975 [Tanacetum coccineum]